MTDFIREAQARLAAHMLSGNARLDSDSLAGKPCPKGATAAQTGCVPGKGAAEHTKAAGAKKRRELAREAVGAIGKDKKLGAIERAKQSREIAQKSGIDVGSAGRMVDKATGAKELARGLFGDLPKKALHAAAAEYDHLNHELEEAGLSNSKARKAVIAGYMFAKWTPGPMMAIMGKNEVLRQAMEWLGPNAVVNVKLAHEGVKAVLKATKLTARGLGTAVKMMRGRAS